MERELTHLQKVVLEKLRKKKCFFIAEATERHWKHGEGYYIDDRVPVSRSLRAEFNRANREANEDQDSSSPQARLPGQDH